MRPQFGPGNHGRRWAKRLALVLLVTLSLGAREAASTSLERLLRRQATGDAGEQEGQAAPKAQGAPPERGNSNNVGAQAPPRLYPDLPRQPNFLPPFNAPPSNGAFQSAVPLAPFGMQMPVAGRLNADQQPAPFGRALPPPRAVSPAERLQSQSFADGLGRRLLSLVGLNVNNKEPASQAAASGDQTGSDLGSSDVEPVARALQNSSVLQKLNRGVNSIYTGLSRMYNSTVQEQLAMLEKRLLPEAENGTNPWSQRVAQQVPIFFRQMAGKVGEAQERLNQVWRDIAKAGNATEASAPQQRSFFAPLNQFMGLDGLGGPGRDFIDQFGRSWPEQASASDGSSGNGNGQQGSNQRDLGARLSELWHTRVAPQIGLVRQQMARVWRDLTSSGALPLEPMVSRSRAGNASASSAGLVDSILKEVDVGDVEYTLLEGDEGAKQSPAGAEGLVLSPQMQNRLTEMQRDLNQLWLGLTRSLQGALANVGRTLTAQQRGGAAADSRSGQAEALSNEASPAQNEISDKIKDLGRLQQDADMVHTVVKRQQQESVQRQSFGDRFMGFLNNVDLHGVNQLPDRIGDQFNRFGNALGTFWDQIPGRWDDFVGNTRFRPRPAPGTGAASPSSTTPASTAQTVA